MQRKVYLTRLKPEFRSQYLKAHENFSEELKDRYRQAGFTNCAVYLLDDALVLVTEAEDQARTSAILAQDPADRAWQSYVAPMKADDGYQLMEQIFRIDL